LRCKICGYSARTISQMAKHYRDKHPKKMRRKKATAVDYFMGRPQKEVVEKIIAEYIKKRLRI